MTEVFCLFHPADGSKIANSKEELEQLLKTGNYFTDANEAREKKYLKYVIVWTILEAADLLAGENPERHPNSPRSDTRIAIYKMMEEDYTRGELKLEMKTNFKNESIFVANNLVFIDWAVKKQINIPKKFRDYLLNPDIFLQQRSLPKKEDHNKLNCLNKEESERNNDKNQTEKKHLTRKAIKLMYQGRSKELTEGKWRHIFNTEKKNGLYKARVFYGQNEARYEGTLVHEWLIENGYYTPAQLLKITNPEMTPKPLAYP